MKKYIALTIICLLLFQLGQRRLHIHNNLLANISYNLSDIGEGIKEVVIKEWYVKVGDKIQQFDNVCEVQSDKASVTITSRYDGIITKLYYDEDETAFVGKPLIDIETDEEISGNHVEESQLSISTTENTQSIDTENKKPAHPPKPSNDLQCIPSVRRLAKVHEIDLDSITGTGKNGRILKEDILRHLDQPMSKPPTKISHNRIEKVNNFQKTMISTMTNSNKIPQFLYTDEIKVTQLSNLRNVLKTKEDLKVSFVPFFIKAISNALLKYPIINASLDEHCEHIIYHHNHNIGVAMDTAQGLAVPVIKNVQEMGIMDITEELARLLNSGKKGYFSPDDLTGGTFTISNIGSIGGTYAKPLILPPQVAILAVGALKLIPKFDDAKNLIPEEIVNVSASADHRIIDGATMARFIQICKEQLESPYLLLLNK